MESTKHDVLLVDDDPTLLRILSKSLESAGYQIRTAQDGADALAQINARCPDFLITDWEMPRVSGLELCQQVRAAALPQYIYMIMLASKSGTDDLVTALEAGADDFVTKTAGRTELLARLHAGTRMLELIRQLRSLARTDALTGVSSRRAFLEQFEREISRAHRYRLPLTCVMLDVDFFKQINDQRGHPVGDRVLEALGQLLRESCRASDYVGRYGGEEFCILLTETAESAAAVWAERVRRNLSNLRIDLPGGPVQITASFGLAQMLEDTRFCSQLIDMADQALLVAKQTGRDRVVSYRTLHEQQGLPRELLSDRLDPLAGVQCGQVMTTLVASLHQDESIGRAADFFLRFRINSSPVVDDQGLLVGMLSEKDLMGVMMQPGKWNRPIREVMKTNVVCYEEQTSVKTVYDFLCRVSIRRVIIVKDGFPTGIISRGTLLRWFNIWMTVNGLGQLPETVPAADSQPQSKQELAQRQQELVKTAQTLAQQASRLQVELSLGEDRVIPSLIAGASRMQEMINDLLAESRFFLDTARPRPAALPLGDAQSASPGLPGDEVLISPASLPNV